MLHAEAEDWRSMVVPHPFLLGIEANALANDSRFGTGRAPNRKRHLEADGEDALTSFARTRAKCMLARELVSGGGALVLWRDITSHI